MSKVDRFKASHRAARRNWEVSEGFPNRAVLAAYRHPTVEDFSKDKFRAEIRWRPPNLEGLRIVCRETFGWAPQKTDEQLLPVLRKLASNQTQTTLESYMISYHDNVKVAKIRSKRMRDAVQGLTGREDVSDVALVDGEEVVPEVPWRMPQQRGGGQGKGAAKGTSATATASSASPQRQRSQKGESKKGGKSRNTAADDDVDGADDDTDDDNVDNDGDDDTDAEEVVLAKKGSNRSRKSEKTSGKGRPTKTRRVRKGSVIPGALPRRGWDDDDDDDDDKGDVA